MSPFILVGGGPGGAVELVVGQLGPPVSEIEPLQLLRDAPQSRIQPGLGVGRDALRQARAELLTAY